MNNDAEIRTVCLDCGRKVTINSIHTCSSQLKYLTDDEIIQTYADIDGRGIVEFARAILRKAQEK